MDQSAAGIATPGRGAALEFRWPFWRPVPGVAALTVEGQRLDADANHPTLAVFFPESDEHAQLQAVVLHFPAAECWRVTARSAASTLTFVTLVGPPR